MLIYLIIVKTKFTPPVFPNTIFLHISIPVYLGAVDNNIMTQYHLPTPTCTCRLITELACLGKQVWQGVVPLFFQGSSEIRFIILFSYIENMTCIHQSYIQKINRIERF